MSSFEESNNEIARSGSKRKREDSDDEETANVRHQRSRDYFLTNITSGIFSRMSLARSSSSTPVEEIMVDDIVNAQSRSNENGEHYTDYETDAEGIEHDYPDSDYQDSDRESDEESEFEDFDNEDAATVYLNEYYTQLEFRSRRQELDIYLKTLIRSQTVTSKKVCPVAA